MVEAKSVPEIANIITLFSEKLSGSRIGDFLHHFENLIFSLIIVVFLSIIAYLATYKKKVVPSGLQNFVELVVESLESFIYGILGDKEGRRYLPYVGTLFLYILLMNLSGLIPGMKSPTSSLNTTAALAICTFFYVQYTGIRRLGILGYLDHMSGNPRLPEGKGFQRAFLILLFIPIHILLFFIHIIGELVKPLSLALRLFGNITGEDALLALFVGLGIASLSFIKSPVGLPLQIPAMFLSLILGTVQAIVFSLLSSIYIAMMLPAEHQ